MSDKRRTQQAMNAIPETIARLRALLNTDPLDWTSLPETLHDDIRAVLRFLGIPFERYIQRVRLNAEDGRETIEELYAMAKRRGVTLELRSVSEDLVEVFEIGDPIPTSSAPPRGSPEWVAAVQREYRENPVNQAKFAEMLRQHGVLVEDSPIGVPR